MPLNGLYIIATPFFSRDSIQRQVVRRHCRVAFAHLPPSEAPCSSAPEEDEEDG